MHVAAAAAAAATSAVVAVVVAAAAVTQYTLECSAFYFLSQGKQSARKLG
jgi:hypothetical protein